MTNRSRHEVKIGRHICCLYPIRKLYSTWFDRQFAAKQFRSTDPFGKQWKAFTEWFCVDCSQAITTSMEGLYRYVTRTNVPFFDLSPNLVVRSKNNQKQPRSQAFAVRRWRRPGKIRFIVPEKNRMRSETQPYSTVLQYGCVPLCMRIFSQNFGTIKWILPGLRHRVTAKALGPRLMGWSKNGTFVRVT